MTAPTRILKPVHFEGPAGRLEGLWSDPGGGLAPAIICHPHPAHGGSMHSKVVHTVYRVLSKAGHPAIRFNFRGVGASQGSFSGWDGEIADVAAAAAATSAISPSHPENEPWLAPTPRKLKRIAGCPALLRTR